MPHLTGEPSCISPDGVEAGAQGGQRHIEFGLRPEGGAEFGIDYLAQDQLSFPTRRN